MLVYTRELVSSLQIFTANSVCVWLFGSACVCVCFSLNVYVTSNWFVKQFQLLFHILFFFLSLEGKWAMGLLRLISVSVNCMQVFHLSAKWVLQADEMDDCPEWLRSCSRMFYSMKGHAFSSKLPTVMKWGVVCVD